MKDLPNLVEKFVYLNDTLESRKFLLGDKFSICDLSVAMLIENTQICKDFINVKNYNNIVLWLNNIKTEVGKEKWDIVMEPFYKTMIK